MFATDHIKDLRMHKETDNILPSPYCSSLEKTTYSNSSLISSNSSSSNRYSSSIEQPYIMQNEIDQFDIIDSLDYDDVDDHIINQEILHQQREGYVKQLYKAEANYIDFLNSTINDYMLPLQKHSKSTSFSILGIKKQPCTEKEIQLIFSNIQDIHRIHKEHLFQLNERFKIWGPTQIISDVIQDLFPYLKDCYQPYFDNYENLLTTFEKLSRCQPFKKFIETIDKFNNRMTSINNLLSLLRIPVNYMQHYQHLLNNLVDNTSSMHPDYAGLVKCKAKFESILEHFREKFEDMKNVDKVFDIFTHMTGHPFSMKAKRRLCLQNKHLTVICKSSIAEDRACFLFNDVLIFAKQKSNSLHYKGHIALYRAKARTLNKPIESKEKNWAIEISSSLDPFNSSFMNYSSVYVIRTYNKEEQTKWMNTLDSVIAHADQTKQISRVTLSYASIHSRKSNLSFSSGSTASVGTNNFSNASINTHNGSL